MTPTLGPQYHGNEPATRIAQQKTPEPDNDEVTSDEDTSVEEVIEPEPEEIEPEEGDFDDDTPAEEPERRRPTPDVEYGPEDDPPI